MSSIGMGIAASVAAQSASERQAITSKNSRERDADRIRRELEDRFSPTKARVEEAGAVSSIEGDEESPADTHDQKKQRRDTKARANNDAEHSQPEEPKHIDLKA